MSYPPQDPNGQQQPYDPYGQQQPQYGEPSGYDASGYPQYDQPQSAPPVTGGPYQPYGQQPYAQQPYQQPYAYAQPKGTNTMAILALVFAFVFAPVAIVLGHMAKKQIRETGEEGDGLAMAGLIMGYIFTGLWVLVCVCYGFGFAAMLAGTSTSSY